MTDSPEFYASTRRQAPKFKWMNRIGHALTGIVVLFLLFDAAIKIFMLPVVVDTIREIGWPPSLIVPLGVVLLISTVLYVIPRTALLGAILLTAYLGGAVATHARIGNPIATHTLFGVYVGVVLWLGLVFRTPLLQSALGFRSVDRAER